MSEYITITQVRNVIGVGTDDIADDIITQAISFACDEIDRLTFTQYLLPETDGTVTSATGTTLTETSAGWTINEYSTYSVYIYSGTGKGQMRDITSNTADTLTVPTWDTNPDNTSKYFITYETTVTETYDGTGTNTMVLNNIPLIQVDSLTIDGTSVTPSYIETYPSGKIILNTTAEKNSFTAPTDATDYKLVTITYKYGVLPVYKRGTLRIEGQIKRLITIIAGLQALAYQIGGTYNDISTFSISGISGSLGEPYVNIRSLVFELNKEKDRLLRTAVGKYTFMA